MPTLTPDVIVALDCDSRAAVDKLLDDLQDAAQWFKIGIQTLVSSGPDVARDLISAGRSVFLDLKLHEVPNSVAGAVTAVGDIGASMVTVHSSAGRAVLEAAVRAAHPYPDLHVLALTVITSLSDDDLPSLGIRGSVADQVDRLARNARNSGCDGVVCSVLEISSMRTLWGEEGLVVTPGIGLGGTTTIDPAPDQVRVGDPEHARKSGASHVVLGRSLTAAADVRGTFDDARRRFIG